MRVLMIKGEHGSAAMEKLIDRGWRLQYNDLTTVKTDSTWWGLGSVTTYGQGDLFRVAGTNMVMRINNRTVVNQSTAPRAATTEELLARIEAQGLDPDRYRWYLDLRRYGTFVHSGFGLGVERTVAWICGIPHIRETIAFPRQIHRLYP